MGIKEKIKELPNTPGVYIMKDKDEAVLYVGKAINLKKRVSSYFYPNRQPPGRIGSMVSRIEKVEHIKTATEAEALIYENSLIKQLSPKYNIALRDDKSYPLLKLTVSEKFPRLFITRQKKPDGSLYYGPYSNPKLLRQAVLLLRQLFPLRSCGKMPKSVCLNYHIRQCLGPCAGYIDNKAYAETVAELKLFLDGRKKELIKVLTDRMIESAGKEDFEQAAALKGRVEALSSIREKSVYYGAGGEVEELRNVLGLDTPPDLIEAFDVSNISGKEAVGAMVSFYKGRPKKSGYRRFGIKTVIGPDDYSMMRELVDRRYSRMIEEGQAVPDLVLIDGGRGHLAAASEELERLGLGKIPVASIAKEFERIFVKNRKDAIVLPKESKALHLVQRIRDEAHRFAIAYHKSLRSKAIEISELDAIPGIGRKRKKALMDRFETINKIKIASIEELLQAKGMNAKSAKSVIEYFKG